MDDLCTLLNTLRLGDNKFGLYRYDQNKFYVIASTEKEDQIVYKGSTIRCIKYIDDINVRNIIADELDERFFVDHANDVNVTYALWKQ